MAGNTVKEMTTNFGKLDKFEGHDFRRWQTKMHFLLTTLNNVESAKKLWDSLESKYMAEDASSKKFIDFKRTLKHGRDDLSLVQLGSYLRIEESLRTQDSDNGKKRGFNENNDGSGSNKTLKLECWKCGETGHFNEDCRSGKKKNNANAVEDGYVLYMGDDHFAPVHGKRSVVLEISSGKSVTLFNVLYVPKIHKNLISGHGCMAVVRVSDPKRKTLGEKGIDCIFVGYVEHSKAYRFYVIEPNDSVSFNTIIGSRDAIFDENRFSFVPRPKEIIQNYDESQKDDYLKDVPSETLEPRRDKRARKAKSYGSDFQLYLVEGSRDQIGSQYCYCYSIEEDPRNYNEAM
nr:zinc finger, CCHC-type [Tanacetum cinerariifolium]